MWIPHRAGARESGDVDQDGVMNITDGIDILGFLFGGAERPACMQAADVDRNLNVEITDAVFAFRYLFLGETEPPLPGPPGHPCGRDPDGLGAEFPPGCAEYLACGGRAEPAADE